VIEPLDLAALREVAVSVAYRMLGSRTDAEDLAHDALLKVQEAARTTTLRSPEAFVVTVTTRLAIDHLRSARVRRETYVGPWLPEPVTSLPPGDGRSDAMRGDGAREAELADSLSFAFLVVLESLGPVERAAFLLRDVFGFGYDELATTLDRNAAACRQLVSRARARVADGRRRLEVDANEHRRLLERFVAAARDGDVDQLVSVLAHDAVITSDGGANLRAARWPIVGQDRVARFLGKIGPRSLGISSVDLVELNGELGFAASVDGHVTIAGLVEVVDGRISVIRWVLNPDKLAWVTLPTP
jgi:RNA polymerase sigma-70 factor (ECF subfamily)